MFMKKKFLKLKVLMIVVLLSCLKSFAQDVPSTGEINDSTTYVSIPIEYIRLANQKMIERNYLEEVNQYKDSIITDYRNYIVEYERIHQDYTKRIEEYSRINNSLNKRLAKQKKATLVFGTVAGVSVATIVLIALVN